MIDTLAEHTAARAMYAAIYSDGAVMSLAEAESFDLVRRLLTSQGRARGILRRCNRALRRLDTEAGENSEVSASCDTWCLSLTPESFGSDELVLNSLAALIDDFVGALRNALHEGCCFDYLVTILAIAERCHPRLARAYADSLRVFDRAVVYQDADFEADVDLEAALRIRGLPRRCARGWVCDRRGVAGLEDVDDDPCA